MGHTKDLYRDFAIAFWKIVKALLEMKEIFSRDHDVSDLFVVYFLKPENEDDHRKVFYNILDSLEWFKGKWTASRYPFIKDKKVRDFARFFNLKIVELQGSKKIAERSYQNAKKFY